MGKKIIVLSDGTGNSAAHVWRTNVWRMFQAIELNGDKQIAAYDDGVGTSSFLPLALLGGTSGSASSEMYLSSTSISVAIVRKVTRYTALAPAVGAFTIRVLIKLVLNQGLVSFVDDTLRCILLSGSSYLADILGVGGAIALQVFEHHG